MERNYPTTVTAAGAVAGVTIAMGFGGRGWRCGRGILFGEPQDSIIAERAIKAPAKMINFFMMCEFTNRQGKKQCLPKY
jgi:hypothetical protein